MSRFNFDCPGYDKQSVYGWDPPFQSFYAQIWRNRSRSDEPDFWIDGMETPLPTVESLVREIVRVTRIPADKVRAALVTAYGLGDRAKE